MKIFLLAAMVPPVAGSLAAEKGAWDLKTAVAEAMLSSRPRVAVAEGSLSLAAGKGASDLDVASLSKQQLEALVKFQGTELREETAFANAARRKVKRNAALAEELADTIGDVPAKSIAAVDPTVKALAEGLFAKAGKEALEEKASDPVLAPPSDSAGGADAFAQGSGPDVLNTELTVLQELDLRSDEAALATADAKEQSEAMAEVPVEEVFLLKKTQMQEIDTDGDGLLSAAELTAEIQKLVREQTLITRKQVKQAERPAMASFVNHLDRNRDGVVTEQEFFGDSALTLRANTVPFDIELFRLAAKACGKTDAKGGRGLDVDGMLDFHHPEFLPNKARYYLAKARFQLAAMKGADCDVGAGTGEGEGRRQPLRDAGMSVSQVSEYGDAASAGYGGDADAGSSGKAGAGAEAWAVCEVGWTAFRNELELKMRNIPTLVDSPGAEAAELARKRAQFDRYARAAAPAAEGDGEGTLDAKGLAHVLQNSEEQGSWDSGGLEGNNHAGVVVGLLSLPQAERWTGPVAQIVADILTIADDDHDGRLSLGEVVRHARDFGGKVGQFARDPDVLFIRGGTDAAADKAAVAAMGTPARAPAAFVKASRGGL
jgi:hypothetical protein